MICGDPIRGLGVYLEVQELFNAKARLAEDGTKGAGRRISAVHGKGHKQISGSELQVASALADFVKPRLFELPEDLPRSQKGQARRHQRQGGR